MTPVQAVFSLFNYAIPAVFGWFLQIVAACGALGVYLAVFVIFCVVRFLIAPIIGRNLNKVGED